ncbi:hypothetical protein P0082_10075 [Candidatus Haliotispira prima]|uniref:Lipoprotein n=1 Tax=Candidatus Haliotispira prima TaxID=3034016 RepID=A0ABY8MHL4_9SPIO|nr:hypothetical protein P0082_10075 [Candidatus Haliotispira prima]
MPACAPLPETSEPPAAAKPSVSFSVTAVVSSLELEVSSSIAITKVGAVIRLAGEAAPTKAEAEASAGYVSLAIAAGSPIKFSISQHYGSDFTDGLTLADVLTVNTPYKLYLFFEPDAISLETTIEGATLTNDIATISFTTATLPPAGDAKWLSDNGKCVPGLDALYFMPEQKGVVVCYFYLKFIPVFFEASVQSNSGTYNNLGIYVPNTVEPAAAFNFTYGSIPGYTSDSTNHYSYWMGADKSSILQNTTQYVFSDKGGHNFLFSIPVTRH